MHDTKTILNFRQRGGSGVGFFAQAADETYANAVREAETWGELAETLPGSGFDDLMLWAENGGDMVYYDGNEYRCIAPEELGGFISEVGFATFYADHVIWPHHPFEAAQLPGASEGAHLPFLEAKQGLFLSPEFCEQFGEKVSSFLDGSWWEFPLARISEMKPALENEGFTVNVK